MVLDDQTILLQVFLSNYFQIREGPGHCLFHDITAVHQEWRLRGFAIEVEVINFALMYSIGHSMTAFGTSGNIDVDVFFLYTIIKSYQYLSDTKMATGHAF